MPIKHNFVSTVPDDDDADSISPSDWNDAHTIPAHSELSGLDADDHPQYLREKDLGGTASEVPTHTHATAGEAGTVSHDDLTGVSANDHHAQAHAINGADHTGTLDDSQIPSTIARDTEVTAAVTAHEAALDPHTGYTTAAELTTAVSDHAGAADPHTGYRKESDDHTHASTGAQGGTVSHDVLTGVSIDDHHARDHASTHSNGGADEVTIENLGTSATDTDLVLKPNGTGGVEFGTGGGGVSDHGALTGLADDDHTQYALWSALQASMLVNELMNFPSREKADDTQPEWWEEADANATLTEVDIAGESLASIPPTGNKRAHKVVVATSNSHAYQRFTYADQPRLGAGVTLSAMYLVYSVSGATARIRLQSSVGSLGASSSTVAASWTLLTVQGVTLDGTYVDIREEVDVGTAYFIPISVNIGSKAVPLKPRGTKHVVPLSTGTAVANQAGAADPATWTEADITSITSPLTVYAYLRGYLWESTAATEYRFYVRPKGSSTSAGDNVLVLAKYANGDPIENSVWGVGLNDQQIFEWYLDRTAGSSTIDGSSVFMESYEEWE